MHVFIPESKFGFHRKGKIRNLQQLFPVNGSEQTRNDKDMH